MVAVGARALTGKSRWVSEPGQGRPVRRWERSFPLWKAQIYPFFFIFYSSLRAYFSKENQVEQVGGIGRGFNGGSGTVGTKLFRRRLHMGGHEAARSAPG